MILLELWLNIADSLAGTMKEGRVLMTLLSDMVFKKMNEALKVLWDAKVTIITKDQSKGNEIGTNDDRNPEVIAHDLPCKVSTTSKNATAPEGDIIKARI